MKTASSPSKKASRMWVDMLMEGRPNVAWSCLQQGWGTLRQSRSVMGLPLRLGGRGFPRGLGTHADSVIRLQAVVPMRRLEAWVGWDDNERVQEARPASRLRFTVEAAGREIWRSPDLPFDAPPLRVSVALPSNTTALLLKVQSTDGQIARTHADWADLVLTLAGGARVAVGQAGAPPAPAPFSFQLGGRSSCELLPQWQVSRQRGAFRRGRAKHRLTWRQPKTGIECRLELEEFKDFPAVEWVLYLRNGGRRDTPIFEQIQALDWPQLDLGAAPTLHRSRGSLCKNNDFQCQSEPLVVGQDVRMVAGGGRSSQNWLPFFNLEGEQRGVIAAIGWSGQWAAEFGLGTDGQTHLRAGMEETHLKLHPGEEIRSPRILLLGWDGTRLAGQNQLRQFIRAHHSPRPCGRPLERGPLTIAHWGGMKSAGQFERIAAYRRQKLAYDYYWVDAGWYGPADSYSPDEFKGDWWQHVGNWKVNPAAHPRGLRPVSDAARRAGMRFLLWFEPERARSGTPWVREHPEWFLEESPPEKRQEKRNLLFNLGDPQARRFVTDFLLAFMKREGVDFYRQDFNFEPLPFWRRNDAPDRRGITEIRHVEGLYAFWDELLARHPGLLIDNCASGGRRIDLETVSRSIALWRSDWQCWPDNDPIGGQVHGMGLSYWLPLHGTGTYSAMPRSAGDNYRAYSSLGSAVQFTAFPYEHTPVSDAYPWAWHRSMLRQMRRAQPLFLGDFYPVDGDTADRRVWCLYQMDRPDLGEGLVVALRRPESAYSAATIRLQGLDPAAVYALESEGSAVKSGRRSGRTLMEQGIAITLPRAASGCLLFYRRV
jgi:alpha-galactosidase